MLHFFPLLPFYLELLSFLALLQGKSSLFFIAGAQMNPVATFIAHYYIATMPFMIMLHIFVVPNDFMFGLKFPCDTNREVRFC